MAFSLKTELLPHQKETVEFAIKTKFYCDRSVMGSGKTLSALATIIRLEVKTMVVVPPYLVNNWVNDIKKHTHLKCTSHYAKYEDGYEVYLVPYTRLNKAMDIFKNVKAIIIDEGHYIKNMKSQRTENFFSGFLKHTPSYFGYLSGTPIKNRIPDIFTMLALFSSGPNEPKILKKYPSYYTFCCRFTNVKQTPFGDKYVGLKNPEELRQYVLPFTIKHGEEVLNLPELKETVVAVDYGDDPELAKDWELYQSKGLILNPKSKVDNAVKKAKFTANYCIEAIGNEEGPVVVFSDHLQPLSIIALEMSGLRVRVIDGSVDVDKRDEYIGMLNNGQLDALLCTYGSASTGYNFTGSSLMVCNDLTWDPSVLKQAKKRVHRIGSKKNVRIVTVVGSTTDEYISNGLLAKSNDIDRLYGEIDGTKIL